MFFVQTAYALTQAECVAQGFLDTLNDAVFYPLIIFLTALAFLVFLWGSFRFVLGAADSGARANGKRHMIYGIIGLLVMVSAGAILTIAANTFGLDSDFEGNPYCVDGTIVVP